MAPTVGDYEKLQKELAKTQALLAALSKAKAEGKPWYKSKGVLTGIGGSVIGVLGLVGINIDLTPEQQVELISALMVVASTLGMIFRMIAKTVLTAKKPPPE